MPLNQRGKRHVEIALKIIAGKISNIDEIPEDDRYFLSKTDKQELKDTAIAYLANLIQAAD